MLLYAKPNKLVVVASIWELETLLVTREKVGTTDEDPSFLGWFWFVNCDELIALGAQNSYTLFCAEMVWVWCGSMLLPLFKIIIVVLALDV